MNMLYRKGYRHCHTVMESCVTTTVLKILKRLHHLLKGLAGFEEVCFHAFRVTGWGLIPI